MWQKPHLEGGGRRTKRQNRHHRKKVQQCLKRKGVAFALSIFVHFNFYYSLQHMSGAAIFACCWGSEYFGQAGAWSQGQYWLKCSSDKRWKCDKEECQGAHECGACQDGVPVLWNFASSRFLDNTKLFADTKVLINPAMSNNPTHSLIVQTKTSVVDIFDLSSAFHNIFSSRLSLSMRLHRQDQETIQIK